MQQITDTTNKYYCKICKYGCSQKSHFDKHSSSEKHILKTELFKLELEKLTKEESMSKYHTTNIDNIIKYIVAGETIKKEIENKVIWEQSDEFKKSNLEYLKNKSELTSLIKKCHQILYSNDSITGVKAMNDILKVLTLKLMQPQFQDESFKNWESYKELKLSGKLLDKYISYCKDLKQITYAENMYNEWKQLISKFLHPLLSAAFSKEDIKFNCSDQTSLFLITEISNFEITDSFKSSFQTSCGDIHEAFMAYDGKLDAKVLGKYYTPRNLLHLIFYGLGVNDMMKTYENPTIYDPCMGTAGFLTRAFNNCDNIKAENIYGCETEVDTIKFAHSSLLLTTGEINTNIQKCDSLIGHNTMNKQNFDIIATNPPFGTSMVYTKTTKVKKGLKQKFEETFKETDVSFEDIYPQQTNNGACLFIQNCIYRLNDGGLCYIVLPDGELFEGDSKWCMKFRKWFCHTVNIKTILKVPGGAFKNAGVKTVIVIFTKTGETQNIQFLQTNKECDILKTIFTVSMEDIKREQYSLDIGNYTEENEEEYNVPMVKLGDICIFKNGKSLTKKDAIKGIYPVIGGGMKSSCYHNDFNRESNTILCSTSGANAGYISKYNKPVWATDCFSINIKKNNINYEYLYLYLKNIQNKIYKLQTGTAQPHFYSKYLSKIKIPLPSLEIQKQIVEKLTKISDNISTLELRNKQLIEEIGMYQENGKKLEIRTLLKGCEKMKLGDVCEFIKGPKKNSKLGKDIGKYPLYYCSILGYKYLDTFDYDGEGLIINSTNGSGKCKIYYINGKYNVGNSTFHFKSKQNNILTKYLYLYLNFNIILLTSNFKGIDKKSITKERLEKIKIPLPSLDIQNKLIELYEVKKTYIEKLNEKIKHNNLYIQELKKLSNDIIIGYC